MLNEISGKNPRWTKHQIFSKDSIHPFIRTALPCSPPLHLSALDAPVATLRSSAMCPELSGKQRRPLRNPQMSQSEAPQLIFLLNRHSSSGASAGRASRPPAHSDSVTEGPRHCSRVTCLDAVPVLLLSPWSRARAFPSP